MKPYPLPAIVLLLLACNWLMTAGAQDFPQKTNLPTVYIETKDQQQITSKENYLNATLRIVDSNGETYYDELGIRGRGNSTWGLAKKPYRIKFNKKQEFLGSGHAKAKSWTLLANYADKSLMRNALASQIASFAGLPFAAASKFVDLVVNGKYMGNYQISDQIEVRGKRVDIVEQEDPMTDDSNITGGYLLEVDGFADSEPCHFNTAYGIKITVKSPDDEIIDQRQTDYIRNYIQEFEYTLFSPEFKDPDKGYRKYIDEKTLISWYVASELTANPDAFWSTYIYKNQDDPKIYWGPLWDYDIAFNNCQRKGDMTRRLILNDGFGADLTGVWIRRMWEDPWFVNAVNEKWKSMVESGIEDYLINFIDQTEALLTESKNLENSLWPINQRVYDEYKVFDSYAETVDFLRKFVHERIQFLSEKFEEEAQGAIPTPPFELEEDYFYRIHNASSLKCADEDSDGSHVCGNSFSDGRHSQQWSIEQVDRDHYLIINRSSGKAITDLAPCVDQIYQKNSQLGLAEKDHTDERQHWKFVPLPTGGAYLIVNRTTDLAWNNSGGNSSEGNPFISWDNDSNNPSKPNRHWLIIRDELKPESGITDITDNNNGYLISYDPALSMIQLHGSNLVSPRGVFSILNLSGAVCLTGDAKESIDISSLTSGAYIVIWNPGDKTISLKIITK